MQKISYMIIILALIASIAIIFSGGGSGQTAQSVEIKNGIQYITVLASGGYSPNKTIAQSGIPTKLIMKTTGSFDCSASLVIRSIGFQKILPQTGETEIDLGIPQKGEPLQGVCGMGMYSFAIDFI
ncbi:MAG: cupredoxin domain-containing protein [Patescibacteria group bacterium]